MIRIPLLILILCSFLTTSFSMDFSVEVPQALSIDQEELTDFPSSVEAEDIFELLYAGRPDSALKLAEYKLKLNPHDPLSYLAKARVLREMLPEQDDNKALIRESAAPVHDILDKAIEICEKSMKNENEDSKLRFYRGWAWMFKAQLHALGASYWSAGRSAARGNKELKKYISMHPDDPDAKGIMGTFLYFADTLPTVIKVIKKLFFIPGGDREKGLAYLKYAGEHDGLLKTDHSIILAAIYTIFEGRFEDGVDGFANLLTRYPDYLRLVEPLSIVGVFYPSKIRYIKNIENSILDRQMGKAKSGANRNTIYRLRYHRSFSNMFFETPAFAINEFTALLEEAPDRPDWLVPLSMVNLGRLYANSGQEDKAIDSFNKILENEQLKRFHKTASKMLYKQDMSESILMAGDSDFIHYIYNSELGPAEAGLEKYHHQKGATVLYDFYHGETCLLAGDIEGASKYFRSALDRKVPNYSQEFQMLAAVRMAEIAGLQSNYKAAEEYLDQALQYYHEEFLIDMLIEGRKRFYDNLSRGELNVIPSLLIPDPDDINASKLNID